MDEQGAPHASGLCQARTRAGMSGRARDRDVMVPWFGQTAAPWGVLCIVLPSSNNPASKAGSRDSNLGFLHINSTKATV